MSYVKIGLIRENHNSTRQRDVWLAKSGFDNEPSVLGCEAVYRRSGKPLGQRYNVTAERRRIQHSYKGYH